MRKILVIALREYNAAVRSKAFIVTLLLMPLLMGGSAVMSVVLGNLEQKSEKKYAVIDRTPGQLLTPTLQALTQTFNQKLEEDESLLKALGPKLHLEFVSPSQPTFEAVSQQRFEVCRRVEQGELAALIDIGPDVISMGELFPDPEKVDDKNAVRIQAKNPMTAGKRHVVQQFISRAVQLERLKAKNINIVDVELSQLPVVYKSKSLTRLDPATGTYVDAADQAQIVNLFLPMALIMLMFMTIMVGATPAMQGVVEEKGQRIAEVLLGSVTPFQLMAGKLMGVLGVSLTMALVYLGGSYVLAWRFGFASMLPPGLIIMFIFMEILALMIFGSIFIAVGAAATDIKDTQTLLMPIMVVATLPFFALGPIMQDPNGPVARVVSFFPTATPMLLVARESVPPGVPWWEMLIGVVLVVATSLFCLWAAGRIFRIGILLHGKGPRVGDLVRWVMRG